MSTTLPHGIIQINEGNISWYGDITANWQLVDSKIGEYDAAIASIPAPANNGTLTINYGGTTLAMFGADDAGDVSADIPAPGDGTLTVTQGGSTLGAFTANQATPETIDIPAPGDGTLTIRLNGTDVQTFTANQSTNATANIQCVDLTSTQTIGGNKAFTGFVIFNPYRVQIKQGSQEIGVVPSSNQWNGIAFTDKNGRNTFSIEQGFMTSGNTVVHFSMVPNIAGGSLLRIFESTYIASTAEIQTKSRTLIPDANNSRDLGSSSNVWRNVYANNYYLGNTAFGNIVTHNASEFVLVSDLATVATSGSYNDLSNKPTIPTVNDATLTIQQNGVDIGTFSANQETNETINIEVPDALPTGSYIQFAGSQAPAGFLVCNGGAISRTTYSALFDVIGTTYGSGDGSTTFNLPNLTDRFLQGSSTSGTVKEAGLPNITGGFGDLIGGSGTGSHGTGCFSNTRWAGDYQAAISGSGSHYADFDLSATRSSSIYGNSSTVQPPALTCLICIKY